MLATKNNKRNAAGESEGLAAWLLARFRGARRPQQRLQLIERIALAPRQSLALIEAEGRRFLVASSADNTPAFFPIDSAGADARTRTLKGAQRVSW
jgi:flagellar biogenesis protein FliO